MKKSYQKIVVIVSGFALLTTMTVAGFSFRQSPSDYSQQGHSGNPSSMDEQLRSTIEGYEIVLQREPDNLTAKQGLEEALRILVATQIQAQNLEQAIPPMEKLAALVPENDEYQNILQQMKQEQERAASSTSPTQPETNNSDSDEPLPLIIPEAEPNPLLDSESEPNNNPF